MRGMYVNGEGVKSDAPLYFVAARGKIHRLEEYIETQPLRSVRAESHEREQRTTGDKDIVYDNGLGQARTTTICAANKTTK